MGNRPGAELKRSYQRLGVIFLIDILSIVILLFLAYQDVRSRGVSWILFPVLFLLFLLKTLQVKSVSQMLTYFGLNILMLLAVLALLTLYFFIREGKIQNIVDRYLGLGDICFWLVSAVCFAPVNFVLFFLASLILSLIIHLIVSQIQKDQTVPLAGYQSLCLIVLVVFSNIYSSGSLLLSENWFINLLVI